MYHEFMCVPFLSRIRDMQFGQETVVSLITTEHEIYRSLAIIRQGHHKSHSGQTTIIEAARMMWHTHMRMRGMVLDYSSY